MSEDSDYWPIVSVRVWDEEDARNLSLMCEDAHEHGALAGIELTHGGVHARSREARTPPIGPSQLASDYEPLCVPKAMDKEDIHRVCGATGWAARLSRDAGFDIVYVYGGHSYLPLQFLSPFYNRRTDEYGGSFENRARFWLETLEDVRRDWRRLRDRRSFLRRGAGAGGRRARRGSRIRRARRPPRRPLGRQRRLDPRLVEGLGHLRYFTEGYQLEDGAGVEVTPKPIVGVGRLTNPDRMAEIVRSGVWDLIGAARPSISDPFLPKKIEEGRYGEIRECIGCNICAAGAEYGNQIRCTQNATVGEEYRRGWHPERFEPAANADRDVLVVGPGPRAWSAPSFSASAACAASISSRRSRDRRDHAVGPRLPGLGNGAASSTGARSSSRSSRTSR